MKYLDIILKAACIAVFIVNISNTISLVAFGLYCLFQQSGITFFSIGKPQNMLHKAQDIEAIDQYIQTDYNGQYTVKHITLAIQKHFPNISYKDFVNQLKFYKNYLAFKDIEVSSDYTDMSQDTPKIDDAYEAITYHLCFMHKGAVFIPEKYIQTVKDSHLPISIIPEPTPGLIFKLGYARHLQTMLQYTPSYDKPVTHNLQDMNIFSPSLSTPSKIEFMLQIGNQYKLRTKTNSLSLKYYGLSVLSLLTTLLNPIAWIPAILSTAMAIYKHQSDDFFTLNIGYDPKSPASGLYASNPDNNRITYSLGAITLNIFFNILLFYTFSFLGAANILSMLPLYSLTALAMFTIYDRSLVLMKQIPLMPNPIKSTYLAPNDCVDHDDPRIQEIGMPRPYGINLPSMPSKGIQLCHNMAYQLTHLI